MATMPSSYDVLRVQQWLRAVALYQTGTYDHYLALMELLKNAGEQLPSDASAAIEPVRQVLKEMRQRSIMNHPELPSKIKNCWSSLGMSPLLQRGEQ